MVLALAVAGAASYWILPAVADPGPSYFSGDDTKDSYGGAGVTWDGTPSYAPGHTGSAGDRAFVVGPNGVLAATDPTLGNFGTADFTLHFYTRLQQGGDQRAEILSKRPNCAGGSFLDLRAGTQFGGVYFEIQDLLNFGFNVTNPADLFDDTWHEITATRAGTRVTLTVDGVTTSGTTNGVVNIDNNAPLRFGDGGCVGTLGDGTTRGSGRLDAISFGPGTAVVGPPPRPTTPPSTAVPLPTAPTRTAPTAPPPTQPPAQPPQTTAPTGAVSSPGRTTVPATVAPTTATASIPPPTSTTAPTSPPVATAVPTTGPTATPTAGPTATPTETAEAGRKKAGVEFPKSVPTPREIRIDLPTLAQSALLAILLLALLALPIGVINDTAEENADRFAGLAARVRRLRNAVVVVWSERLRFAIGLGLAALAGAVLYGFLEPAFRFDLSSLALVLGLALAFLVVSAAKELSQYLYLGQAYDVRGFLRLFPAFGVVGLMCVTVSRAIGLQPGLMLGTLAALGTRSEPSAEQKGRAAAVSSASLAVIGVLGLVLRGPFIEDTGFGDQVVAVALTAVTVAAAENLAFGLLPLSFLDGAALFAWSKPVWFGFSLLGTFAFVHVLLNREAGAFGERVIYLAILLAVYFTFAGAFWAYFRFTRAREPAGSPG